MKTKIIKINENYLKEAFEISCCLHHVQIYAKYVQPNHLSVIDAFVYHKLLFEHIESLYKCI